MDATIGDEDDSATAPVPRTTPFAPMTRAPEALRAETAKPLVAEDRQDPEICFATDRRSVRIVEETPPAARLDGMEAEAVATFAAGISSVERNGKANGSFMKVSAM